MNIPSNPRRRRPNQSRRRPVQNFKSLTANAPFRVRSSLLPHIPTHGEGLTVDRVIRISARAQPINTTFTVSYELVFSRFLEELGIATISGVLSFSPMAVSFYGSSNLIHSINCRIYDEPRQGTVIGTPLNGPFFEATDSAPVSGVCTVKAVIPKACTYTLNNGEAPVVRNLPFCSVVTSASSDIFIDVRGTFTIKTATGQDLHFSRLAINVEPDVESRDFMAT